MITAAKKPTQLIRAITAGWRPTALVFLCAVSLSSPALAQDQDKAKRHESIESLVVTATRLPRATQDIAGTISVITAEAIEHQLVDDLDDLIRFLPGISMDSAKRGGNEGFRIRGIGGNRVLTVIDGVRSSQIYEAGPASYGIDSFEVDNLKAVEIIRGPASVLYGADALGGVVLFTNKEPEDYIGAAEGTYFNLRSSAASANDQYKLGFTGAHQFGRGGLVAQFTRREFGQRQVKGDGRLNPQDGNSDALFIKAFWDISAKQRLRVSVDAVFEDIDVQVDSNLGRTVTRSVGLDETDRVGLRLEYEWDAEVLLFDRLHASLHQQNTDGSQHTEQQRISYSFLDPADPNTFGGTPGLRVTDFEFNQETVALTIDMRKSIATGFAAHTLAYGLNYDVTDTERPRNRCEQQISTGAMTCQIRSAPRAGRDGVITVRPTEDFPNKTFPDSNTKRSGVYLQDEIIVANTRLTIIPGIRYDRYRMTPQHNESPGNNSRFFNEPRQRISTVDTSATSFSLGAIYDLSNDISLFAQYAEGYRPPNFNESNQAFVNLAGGYAVVPNPGLRSESSEGVELGVKAGFDTFKMSLAAYQNTYKDFINSEFLDRFEGIYLYQQQNIGRVSIKGVELTANWFLSEQWQLHGSLAFAEGEDTITGKALDDIDPLTAVLGIRFEAASDRWGGELLLTAVDDKDRVSASNRVTADDYYVVDLLAHYKLTDAASVRVGVFNLFDTNYARWSSIKGLRVTGRSAASSATAINNAQQPGTNFRVALKLSF